MRRKHPRSFDLLNQTALLSTLGGNRELGFSAARRSELYQDRHEAGCIFLLPILPLQLTKIGNRLGDYARPIAESNRR
jgi:hypothetical protein